jgi:hypothetical protein
LETIETQDGILGLLAWKQGRTAAACFWSMASGMAKLYDAG